MSCGSDRPKCGITISITALQIVIGQATCNYKNIYDPCEQTWGDYGLSGCVSQGPDYSNITSLCDQNWGLYGLAGCVSYVSVAGFPGSGGSIGGGTTSDGVIGEGIILGIGT